MDLSAETFLSVCFISSMEDLGMTKIALMIHYVLTNETIYILNFIDKLCFCINNYDWR